MCGEAAGVVGAVPRPRWPLGSPSVTVHSQRGACGAPEKDKGPAGAGMGFSRYLRVGAGTPLQTGHVGPATFPGMP